MTPCVLVGVNPIHSDAMAVRFLIPEQPNSLLFFLQVAAARGCACCCSTRPCSATASPTPSRPPSAAGTPASIASSSNMLDYTLPDRRSWCPDAGGTVGRVGWVGWHFPLHVSAQRADPSRGPTAHAPIYMLLRVTRHAKGIVGLILLQEKNCRPYQASDQPEPVMQFYL